MYRQTFYDYMEKNYFMNKEDNMKYVKFDNKARNVITIKKRDYQMFLNIILRHTDTVCFTVFPYLDDIQELQDDIRYEKIVESYIDSEFTSSIHTEKCQENLLYFKLDYNVREFLKEKEDVFDFYDEEASINLEDVVFIQKESIVCDTITHEQYCAVTDELLLEMESKINT